MAWPELAIFLEGGGWRAFAVISSTIGRKAGGRYNTCFTWKRPFPETHCAPGDERPMINDYQAKRKSGSSRRAGQRALAGTDPGAGGSIRCAARRTRGRRWRFPLEVDRISTK